MEEEDIRSLADSWQVQLPPELTEEELLNLLSERISRLLAHDTELFFQIMYRLDISEARLNEALGAANPPDAIARLIWNRQWKKAKSRKEHPPAGTPDDELKW